MKVEDAPGILRDILDLADRATDRTLARGGELEHFSLAFIARAAQALQSTSLLAAHGFIGDATSVARTVIELDIDLAYIRKKQPAKRMKMFCAHQNVSNAKIANAIDRLHRGKTNQNFLSAIRTASKAAKALNPDPNARSWAGIDLRERAVQVRRAHVYDLAYREACGASHSSLATLRYAIRGDEKSPTVSAGPSEPDMRPVRLACLSMLMLIGTPLKRQKDKDLIMEIRAIAKRLRDAGTNDRRRQKSP